MTKLKNVYGVQGKASALFNALPGTAKTTKNNGEPWAADEVKKLRALAKQKISARLIGLRMGRTPASIRSKFAREGIAALPRECDASKVKRDASS